MRMPKIVRSVPGVIAGAAVVALVAGSVGVAVAAIPDAGSGTIHGCYKKSSGTLRVVDKAKGQHCSSSEKKVDWNQRGINWRGAYSKKASYARNDAVSSGGSSYLAVSPSKGVPVTDVQVWAILAKAGATGPAGPQGLAGTKGEKGDPGLAGPKGEPGPAEMVYVRTGPYTADPGITRVWLFCPVGLSPTGGGYASGGSDESVSTHASFPFDDNMLVPDADSDSIPDNGWAVDINNTGTGGAMFAAYAVCASATTVSEDWATLSATTTTATRAGGVRGIIAKP